MAKLDIKPVTVKELKLSAPEKERVDTELGEREGDKAGSRTPSEDESRLVKLAVKQYTDYHEFYSGEIAAAKEDILFRGGGDGQWIVDGIDYKAIRTADDKLSLTKNRVPAFVDNVTGDLRQNLPRIKYSPSDSKTDPKLAEIYNAAVRYMQSVSRAHRQLIPAFEQACNAGYPGWIQLLTDYVDAEKGDEQEIYMRFIPSQFGPALDHTSIVLDEPGKGGPKWGHIPQFYTWAEFKDRFPDARATSWDAVKDLGMPDLFNQQGVTVMSYYRAVPTKKCRCDMMVNGQIVRMLKSSDEYKAFCKANPDMKPETEREFTKWRIDHYLMTGSEILLGPEPYIGKFIPLIPLEGKYYYDAEGKKRFSSVFRDAKDAFRMENWMSSELIELMSDEPYMGDPRMIKGAEKIWQSKNKKKVGWLPATVVDGQLPRKEDNSQKLQGLFRMIPQMIDDGKAIIGIHNASLGATSNETSGRAINARDAQSTTTNFAFTDNGMIAPCEYIGMQFIDLFPKVYDYEKTFKIMGEDGQENGSVTINKTKPTMGDDGVQDGPTYHEFKGKRGEIQELMADLDHVRFDITVDVGPGAKTQRMEAVESMVRMSQSSPVFAEASAGQVAKMLDYPDSDKIAKRVDFIMNIKYQGIDQVGDDEPNSPQARTRAAVQQAIEQFKQSIQPGLAQTEQAMQQMQAQLQENDQEKASLQAKVDASIMAMKDKTAEWEQKERERELRAELEREKIDATVRVAELGVEQAQAAQLATVRIAEIKAESEAQDQAQARAIAELQSQIDALAVARKEEMAQIMSAIEKDDAEKERENGDKGAEALATLTEEIRKIATRPIEITMNPAPRGPLKIETRDKSGEIIRTSEAKEEE